MLHAPTGTALRRSTNQHDACAKMATEQIVLNEKQEISTTSWQIKPVSIWCSGMPPYLRI
jgi:hypothetical protein